MVIASKVRSSRLSLEGFYIFKVSTLINLMMLDLWHVYLSQFKPIHVLGLGEATRNWKGTNWKNTWIIGKLA